MPENIQFDEDNIGYSYNRQKFYTREKSKLSKFVENFGVSEEYVNYVLVGIVIISIILSVLFFKISVSGTKTKIEIPTGNFLIDTKDGPPRLEYPVK